MGRVHSVGEEGAHSGRGLLEGLDGAAPDRITFTDPPKKLGSLSTRIPLGAHNLHTKRGTESEVIIKVP